jgi:hypothetical protein
MSNGKSHFCGAIFYEFSKNNPLFTGEALEPFATEKEKYGERIRRGWNIRRIPTSRIFAE